MTLTASRIARPVGDGGGRSIGWWGAAFGILTLAHLVGGALVAAVYLRAYAPVWPPFAGEAPGMGMPTVAVALTLGAAAFVSFGERRTRLAQGPATLALVAAAILAFVAAGVRGAGTIFSDQPVTEHAYWSIRWALGGLDVILLATLGFMAAAGAIHARRGSLRTGAHSELAVIALWSWATAALVAASWLVFGLATGWGG